MSGWNPVTLLPHPSGQPGLGAMKTPQLCSKSSCVQESGLSHQGEKPSTQNFYVGGIQKGYIPPGSSLLRVEIPEKKNKDRGHLSKKTWLETGNSEWKTEQRKVHCWCRCEDSRVRVERMTVCPQQTVASLGMTPDRSCRDSDAMVMERMRGSRIAWELPSRG